MSAPLSRRREGVLGHYPGPAGRFQRSRWRYPSRVPPLRLGQPLLAALPTLAVPALSCVWNLSRVAQRQRRRRLGERVASRLRVATRADERAGDETPGPV